MHLDAEAIERFLSGELSQDERSLVRSHLAHCAACATAVEAARRDDEEMGRLLNLLDHEIPQIDPRQLVARARRRRWPSRVVAAAIALFVVAGAVSAMPGSPVRAWLSRVFAGPEGTGTMPSGGELAAPTAGSPAGVSVHPGGAFELVFQAVQESGIIRIALAEQAEVVVRSDREGVGYSVEPDGLRILNAGATASYEVVLPRQAESIDIRVRDTVVFQKRQAVIATRAARDSAGRYVLEFSVLTP